MRRYFELAKTLRHRFVETRASEMLKARRWSSGTAAEPPWKFKSAAAEPPWNEKCEFHRAKIEYQTRSILLHF